MTRDSKRIEKFESSLLLAALSLVLPSSIIDDLRLPYHTNLGRQAHITVTVTVSNTNHFHR